MSESPNTPDWLQLNEEWESSRLSQANFCKQKEINPNHFMYQRSKILKKRIYKKSIEFASVKLTSPLMSSEISSEVIVELPGQIKLRIPANKMLISMILDLLREQPT